MAYTTATKHAPFLELSPSSLPCSIHPLPPSHYLHTLTMLGDFRTHLWHICGNGQTAFQHVAFCDSWETPSATRMPIPETLVTTRLGLGYKGWLIEARGEEPVDKDVQSFLRNADSLNKTQVLFLRCFYHKESSNFVLDKIQWLLRLKSFPVEDTGLNVHLS